MIELIEFHDARVSAVTVSLGGEARVDIACASLRLVLGTRVRTLEIWEGPL